MQVFKKETRPLFLNETTVKMIKLNKNGFSVMEVLTASAIASIIAISSAMLVAQGKSVATFGEFHAALEQKHNLALHRVRNTTRLSLQTRFDLFKDDRCFKGVKDSSNACDSAAKDWHAYISDPIPLYKDDGSGGVSTEDTGISKDELIEYSVKYKYDCTSTSCSEMQIVVETKPTTKAMNRGLVAKSRYTQITIPFVMLGNKEDLRFTCAATAVVTAIDYNQHKAICTPTTQAFCGNLPVAGGATACQAGANQTDCTQVKGVKKFGLVATQTDCNPPLAP